MGEQAPFRADDRDAIRNNKGFAHTTKVDDFCMAGVDGSGDFPSFSYADSFVYVATASGTVTRPTPSGIGGATSASVLTSN